MILAPIQTTAELRKYLFLYILTGFKSNQGDFSKNISTYCSSNSKLKQPVTNLSHKQIQVYKCKQRQRRSFRGIAGDFWTTVQLQQLCAGSVLWIQWQFKVFNQLHHIWLTTAITTKHNQNQSLSSGEHVNCVWCSIQQYEEMLIHSTTTSL